MQTFLPYSDFIETAKCLDYRRLGKQRVEADQILNIIIGKAKSNAWRNHPAVKMWEGYSQALIHYRNVIIQEWISRGYNNNMPIIITKNIIYPKWLGDEEFHASHRSNLLRKDFNYYSKYGWKEQSDLPYIWPINNI